MKVSEIVRLLRGVHTAVFRFPVVERRLAEVMSDAERIVRRFLGRERGIRTFEPTTIPAEFQRRAPDDRVTKGTPPRC